MKLGILGFLAALCVAPVSAAELEGVRLDDRVRSGAQELQLNGIALRTRVVFKVYVAGLYLPQKAKTAEEVIAMAGPKRVTLVMLRDVGADTFAGSLMDGLRDNAAEAELARLKPRIDELVAAMQKIGEAKKGTTVVLDYAPGAGTAVVVNAAPQGRVIPGEDLFAALLRIWLGERPVSTDMKKALLGG
jgi:hypothetical protein